ncbi:MAG: indole-3-glycerol phosphate synthase TrpC [Coriobacteriia bacterium]
MSAGVLDRLTASRRESIAAGFGRLTAAECERMTAHARPVRDFAAALREHADVAVIAEVKKASPSRGPIALDCDAARQALLYESGGAAAVSVLTEPDSFRGSYDDLSGVAEAVGVPVLCKDIVVDPVMLHLARAHGADAVLLMASVLGERLGAFVDEAATLGIACLVEVRDVEELETALHAGASIVGVNARDLHDLTIDRARARETVASARRAGVLVVAESGVRGRSDVEDFARAGAHAVLVGETLMRSPSPQTILKGLTGVPKEGDRQ